MEAGLQVRFDTEICRSIKAAIPQPGNGRECGFTKHRTISRGPACSIRAKSEIP